MMSLGSLIYILLQTREVLSRPIYLITQFVVEAPSGKSQAMLQNMLRRQLATFKMLSQARNTNPHCLFPIRGLIDITHARSWHSCLSSSETPAPFLEFPRERPSLTLRCFGWRHSSGQLADCDVSGKEQKEEIARRKDGLKSEGWGRAASSRAFSAAARVRNTAVPSRTPSDWNCFSHSRDQFARMEGTFIFFYGNNSKAIKKEGRVSPQPFYFFFHFVDLQPQRVIDLLFCKAEKRINKLLPFRFFKLQCSAALSLLGSLLNVFNVYP